MKKHFTANQTPFVATVQDNDGKEVAKVENVVAAELQQDNLRLFNVKDEVVYENKWKTANLRSVSAAPKKRQITN